MHEHPKAYQFAQKGWAAKKMRIFNSLIQRQNFSQSVSICTKRTITPAKDSLTAQLATAQQQLADVRSALAVKEREATMLTEQWRRAETRVEGLTEEKLAWLQDRITLEHRALAAEQKATISGSATTS